MLPSEFVFMCEKIEKEDLWADLFSPFCATCGIHYSVSPPCAAGRSSARQS